MPHVVQPIQKQVRHQGWLRDWSVEVDFGYCFDIKDNKIVREIIVEKAINWPIDKGNFISFDDKSAQSNQVDFDKDIDDILSEIENDPDLKIDEKEIQSILSEIEEESKNQAKPSISVNKSAVEDMKKKFTK